MNNDSDPGPSREIAMPDSSSKHHIPTCLDSALAAADRELAENIAVQRSEAVHNDLKELFGDIDLKRLAYRPQPHSPEFIAPGVLPALFPEELDVGYRTLMCTSKCVLSRIDRVMQYRLVEKLRDKGIRFLTQIDAAACLPETQWPSTVKEAHKDINTPGGPCEKAEILKLTHNAKAYVFVQRLIFFICRLQGKSIPEFDARVQRVTSSLGIPPDFNIFDELQRLELHIDANHNETEGAFEESVQMEWRGSPIPVEDVSAPIKEPTGVDCIVCQDALTPPGVVTSCQHAYCRTCLEKWIHAAGTNSHLCCVCRAELSPKPNYRNKYPEGIRKYQQELDWWNRSQKNVSIIQCWASWLSKERELHMVYEKEMV